MITANRLMELLADAVRMNGGKDLEVFVQGEGGQRDPMAGLLVSRSGAVITTEKPS